MLLRGSTCATSCPQEQGGTGSALQSGWRPCCWAWLVCSASPAGGRLSFFLPLPAALVQPRKVTCSSSFLQAFFRWQFLGPVSVETREQDGSTNNAFCCNLYEVFFFFSDCSQFPLQKPRVFLVLSALSNPFFSCPSQSSLRCPH